jgi:Ran GTPase-activating protein (RanGAP) involved in mRNA processing and transport
MRYILNLFLYAKITLYFFSMISMPKKVLLASNEEVLATFLKQAIFTTKRIDLSGKKLSSKSMAQLLEIVNGFDLKTQELVTSIDFSGHIIDESAGNTLANIIKNMPKLSILCFVGAEITDKSIENICNALKNHEQLTYIDLTGKQNIRADGLRSLVLLMHIHPKLRIAACFSSISNNFLCEILEKWDNAIYIKSLENSTNA